MVILRSLLTRVVLLFVAAIHLDASRHPALCLRPSHRDMSKVSARTKAKATESGPPVGPCDQTQSATCPRVN